MALKRWDVLGFGAVAVDDLLYVDGYPMADAKVQVAERRREGGGLAGTALCAAACLGARVAWAGVLGEDELSLFSRTDLECFGVDCSLSLTQLGARPHYSVIVVDRTCGSRTLFAMHDGVQPFPRENVTPELIGACRVLFVDHHDLPTMVRAATLARQLQVPVVADIERLPEGIEALLPLVDHLVVSAAFARDLTGEGEPANMARRLGENRACGVVTCGAQGAWFCAAGRVGHVAAFPVAVVDTTGCGDVFHGAYAASLAQGESLENAVLMACATAALKATQPGGRAGIPDRDMVDKLMVSRRR